jgi:hypothetical protein
MGVEKTRRLARNTVYWPEMYKRIEEMVKTCPACQEFQTNQIKEPLMTHSIPSRPWAKIGMDLFEIKGDDFLLMTDYLSRFPIVHKLPSSTSDTVKRLVAETFSMFGPPDEIISDNGPQFIGRPFQEMCKSWGIKHTTSSPRNPRSNGLAEPMVRTVKSTIKKCRKTKQDVYKALLNIRATPVQPDIPSPGEVLFGRRIYTPLPQQTDDRYTEVRDKVEDNRSRMKIDHDHKHGSQDLSPLYPGQQI